MVTTQKVIQALKTVYDVDQNKDIINLGYARNISVEDSRINFDFIAPSPNPGLVERARKAVLQIAGVSEVKINSGTTHQQQASFPTNTAGLKDVKQIIAVSSCKGGVGKSTVAAHLAVELSRRGLKTGLIDADLYGPSVPALFQIQHPTLHSTEDNKLLPYEKNNLKIMSFGFLIGDNAAVMRGPIVTRYIQQLLLNTAWGELDYLIIDMPPGTGDIHLTITQSAKISGAVIVTTPHTLSMIDVARGILMFEKVSVPIIGVIENMSYFVAPDSEKKHYIFGQSAIQKLKDQFGIQLLAEIPIVGSLGEIKEITKSVPEISAAADKLINYFKESKDIAKNTPTVTFNEVEITLEWPNKEVWKVNNRQLRLNSQDALSVNEITGESLIKPENIRADIAPKQVVPIGNYAINVVWNDGHSAGIYSYHLIKKLAKIHA